MEDFRKKEKRTNFKYEWITDQFKKVRMILSKDDISDKDLFSLLSDKYNKRRLSVGRLYNNVTKEQRELTQEDFINIMLKEDVIMSGYGVLFKQHEGTTNIGSLALNHLLKTRKIYKKEMFKYEKGSPEFKYYDLYQLTFKTIANSYYGVISLDVSSFYNPYIQNSITTTGWYN